MSKCAEYGVDGTRLLKQADRRSRFVKDLMKELTTQVPVKAKGIKGLFGKTEMVPKMSLEELKDAIRRREGVLRATGRWTDPAFEIGTKSTSQKNLESIKDLYKDLVDFGGHRLTLPNLERAATRDSEYEARRLLRAAKRGTL